MDIELFDTEVDLSTPVDVSQIKPNEKLEKETPEEGVQKIGGDTIIELIDKKEPAKEEEITRGDEVNEEVKKEVKKNSPSDKGADSSSTYSTFAKALFEEGVFTDFDEEEFKVLETEHGSAGALIELAKKTIVEQVEAYKNSFTAEQRDVLEAIEKGVPLDKYLGSKAKQQSYASIKPESLEENESLCKELVSDELRLRGLEPEEIKEQLDDLVSLGKLETKAKTSLTKLVNFQKKEIERMKAEQTENLKRQQEANRKQLAELKKDIDGINEVIPGVKINAQTKGKMYEALTTPAAQTESGQWLNPIYAKRSENPKSFDVKLAYLFNLGVFDDKWDGVLNKAKSKAVSELEEKLNVKTAVAKDGTQELPKTEEAKNILNSMKIFKQKRNF